MKGRTFAIAAGAAAAVVVAGTILAKTVTESKPQRVNEELGLPTVVVTLEPSVTIPETPEELPTVVVTLEPETNEGDDETLQADPTAEEVIDIYAPKGSCLAIVVASLCTEYYGSYWTPETMKYHCASATYLPEPCIRPTVGGCQMNTDTQLEMIIWYYDFGYDPFTPDVIPYAAAACEASGGAWLPPSEQ
jgi:hypothetical protein